MDARKENFQKRSKTLPKRTNILPAMTENLPRDADEQAKLGTFYLEKNELEKAIQHLKLAIEIDNYVVEDKEKFSALGAAYFLSGQTAKAEEIWRKVLDEGDESERDQITKSLILFQTLQKYNLGEKVREKIVPSIVKFLENSDADDFVDFQNLIRAVADSFKNETEKSRYFLKILEKRPTDISLAQMLIDENLVKDGEQNRFYELLLARSSEPEDYDYEFREFCKKRLGCRRCRSGSMNRTMIIRQTNRKTER